MIFNDVDHNLSGEAYPADKHFSKNTNEKQFLFKKIIPNFFRKSYIPGLKTEVTLELKEVRLKKLNKNTVNFISNSLENHVLLV